ncbi:MAG: hypothetical protein ACQEWM_12675 [Actinomycetota bacterium]
MTRKPTEIGIQRTSPEAPSLAVQRGVDTSGRQAAPSADARRDRASALGMLIAGCALVAAGILGAGTRLNTAIATAREGSLDPVATFFLGADGASVPDLLLAIALLALIPIGIVLAWLGYRRVTDAGPSVGAMHVSNSPNGVINRIQGTGGGGM